MARHCSKPKFYGKRIREIRGKYFWLRRKLGREKKLRAIKKIGHKEKRIVNDELHKIAKDIVEAERHNAIIAVGNLNGVRRKNNKGRKVNRKINSMPFHRLKVYLKYKALERGILVGSSRVQHIETVLSLWLNNHKKTFSRCFHLLRLWLPNQCGRERS